MKKFEEGKWYKVASGGLIHVEKRTPQYITFTGNYSGRKKVYNVDTFGICGLGENIWIDKAYGKVLCAAGYEA